MVPERGSMTAINDGYGHESELNDLKAYVMQLETDLAISNGKVFKLHSELDRLVLDMNTWLTTITNSKDLMGKQASQLNKYRAALKKIQNLGCCCRTQFDTPSCPGCIATAAMKNAHI
jgi:hypothetical protein